MKDKRWVLLVHKEETAFQTLVQTLRARKIEICHAHTCAQVGAALLSSGPPVLILTEAHLADESWQDVLDLTRTLDRALPVIVLGPSESV
jgi:DNA-binding NtrC family response regulator